MDIQRYLLDFAKEGLRTLVVGQKLIDAKTGAAILKQLNAIKIEASSSSKKEAKLNNLYDKHETGLTFCGSSAIEDKL